MPESPNQEKSPDVGTTLHYISEFFASYRELLTTLRRVQLILLVLSLALLALAAGIVTTKGAMSFSGVGLKVSLAVFLSGGALLVGMIVAGLPRIDLMLVTMASEIVRLYARIHFSDRTLRTVGFPTPFKSFHVVQAALGGAPGPVNPDGRQRRLVLSNILEFLVILSFPAAAEIAAGLKVAVLLRPQGLGWIWILFILLMIVSSGVYILDYIYISPYILSAAHAQEDQTKTKPSKVKALHATVFLALFPLIGAIVGFFVVKVLGSS